MKPSFFLVRAIGGVLLTLLSYTANAAANDSALIQRGHYLATAGDCIACHSAPGGKPMAGGLPLATPLGPIYSTNITPSKTHGIGNYTQEQFDAALRRGVRADGSHLYPAMPYTAYAKVTDDDMKALYAYFMQGVTPVDSAPAKTTALPFPFNIRLSMAGWNLLYLDSKPYVADPSKSVEWNRGAYLARGLAHCGTCHTPRGLLMAEDAGREFGGGAVGSWYAPNITADVNSGIGDWSVPELAEYLRSGRAAGKAQAGGPMAEAIDHSLRHLNAADLNALAVYAKSVPALHDAADTKPTHAWGAAADGLDEIRGLPLPQDLNRMNGAQLYDAHCASCHQARGQGSFDGGLPPLFHNAVLGRRNTDNLVMVMIEGVQRQGDSHEILMPAFGKTLSDQQLATLGDYLVKLYGNPKAQVSVEQVRTLRAGGAQPNLLLLARLGMAGGGVLLIVLIVWLLRRRRRARDTRATRGA